MRPIPAASADVFEVVFMKSVRDYIVDLGDHRTGKAAWQVLSSGQNAATPSRKSCFLRDDGISGFGFGAWPQGLIVV
jgi:hypothetical protein